MSSRFTLVLVAMLFAIPMAARSDEATATLNGTVKSTSGAPISDARVLISGPAGKSTTTDAAGHFTISTTPGLYRLDVTKGGYGRATLSNLALVAGETLPIAVTLQEASLNTLRTIATVSVNGASSINTGAAVSTVTARAAFTNLANPQINNVIARIPGAGIERGSTSPNTSISLGGAQPYETQVLIDGHPVSGGRYGVWFSQFFNSFLLQDVETQTGPGNTTPFASTTIGGTANLVTPNFTGKPTAEFVTGLDNFGAQYSSFLATDRFGKLSTVIGGAVSGVNGPYYETSGCVVKLANNTISQVPGQIGIEQFCGDLSGSLVSKGEILKFRYDLSPSTSISAGFVGSQAGYIPQGTAYGQDAGQTTIVQCIPAGSVSYSGQCGIPGKDIGKTVNGYIFFPGSKVYNNQPIFTGEFRTSLGENTLLVRPYVGNISRIIDGSGEANYADHYSPVQSASCPTAAGGGLYYCPQSAFNLLESDKLHGTTVSFIHPFGENLLNFTYDYHSDDTFAYYGSPSAVNTPDTLEKYNIFSLTGDFALARHLSLRGGLYETNWNLNGIQEIPTTVGSKIVLVPAPLTRSVSRFDPHIALTLSPKAGLSYRASFGTSAVYPYASEVSGSAFFTQPNVVAPNGSITQKNPFLNPETATAFDIGMDKRFGRDSVLSLDLQNTQIHNVVEQFTTVIPGAPSINQPVNVAGLSAQLLTMKYSHEPGIGLGYYATATLSRSIINGVPAAFYSANAVSQPANGQQQCSNGGSQICIPYLKAYAAGSYTLRDKTYFELGADFEGKNNTYNQPPFTIWDLVVKRPVAKTLTVGLSVENLFNTNNFNNLPQPGTGVAQVGQNANGLASILAPLIPAPPRTIRLQLDYHINR